MFALAKGPTNLYVSARVSATDTRLESLDVSNLAAPVALYVSSSNGGAGSQGSFSALKFVASPAGRFLVGIRPSGAGEAFDNELVIYEAPAAGNEALLYRIFTQNLPDALSELAPSSDGSRLVIPANHAGLYQVAMPQTWAPGFSSPPPFFQVPACYAGNATLSVSASANPSGITYQWFRVGVATPIVNGSTGWGSTISGATTPSLLIANVHPRDAATGYYCAATNACGSTIAPTGLDLCAADFNCSGAASVQDIFDFLAAYFASDPRADFNGSGAVSVQDIFDFLAAYFGGCA